MKKLNLSIDKEYKRELDYFSEELQKFKIKFSAEDLGKRVNFLVSLRDKFDSLIVRNMVANIIGIYFKKRYFETAVAQVTAANKDIGALILSCLTFFNASDDITLARKILEPLMDEKSEDGYAIDGIFNFLCKNLKKRWDDVTRLTLDNAFGFSIPDARCELLSFILGTYNFQTEVLTVSENGILQDGKAVRTCKLFDNDKHNTIATIIENNPKQINFAGKGNTGLMQLFSSIIESRIVGEEVLGHR